MINEVLQWNNERGLLNNYPPTLEFNMLLEEVLELKIKDKKDIKDLISSINTTIDSITNTEVSGVSIKDMADAYIDTCIIAIGSLGKLINVVNLADEKDLSIEDIEKIIKVGFYSVTEANNKKPKEKDSNGKIIKGNDFVEPIIPLTLQEIENQYIKPMLKYIYNKYVGIDKDLKVIKDDYYPDDYTYYTFCFNADTVGSKIEYDAEFETLENQYGNMLETVYTNIRYRLYYNDKPLQEHGIDITEGLK